MKTRIFSILRRETLVHPAEGAAATPGATGARATSLATLLASHILSNGELVLLVLKPSVWFIVFSSAAFSAITIAVALLFNAFLHGMHQHALIEVTVFVIAGRLMWAILQWMGRLYVLTDLRVLSLSGVFLIDVFDCPLRKVVRTRIVSPLREKIVALGSIEIIPKDETMASAVWQTIARPTQVYEQLVAAINKAKQSGHGAEG